MRTTSSGPTRSSSSSRPESGSPDLPEMVDRHGGVCYPAHIDRPSNGIIAILGDIPPDFPAECVELNDMSKREELMKSHPSLSGKKFLSGSDAHRLDAIRDAEHTIYLDRGHPRRDTKKPYTVNKTRKNMKEFIPSHP